jgi:D-alanine-D-alanine ligase
MADDTPAGRFRLLVLFGGQSAEHDVSCVTARHVLAAADPDRFDVVPIGITRDGQWVRAADALAALQQGAESLPASVPADGPPIEPFPVLRPHDEPLTTVVLPLLHGPLGEDGTVQGLLDLANVPYVGAGVLGSAVAMDKAMAKQVIEAAGIPQCRHLVTTADTADAGFRHQVADRLGFPAFVKPANMGSSVGVSRATDEQELISALELALSYDEVAVVEEAVDGREIEVAVLGNAEPRASVAGEVRPGGDFYDYEDKYHDGTAELLIPAPLDDDEMAEVRALAVRSFQALRGAGMARVDFFYEEGGRGFLLNEINTIPGFTPISMYPKLWEATGLGYADLITELARLAVERHEGRQKHRRTSRG